LCRKGLISDGLLKYSRNPNYLGEMMIYGSFILLVNDFVASMCVIQVWCSLFVLRIWMKERSLRRKEGWPEYRDRSWLLVPKVNGRVADSVVVYGAAIVVGLAVYQAGGMQKSVEGLARLIRK
jgi:steroid 5-alpha reductase family enzyme